MYRLIYKSTSRGRLDWPALTHVLLASTRNNESNGLTGILLANRSHFLQVLEGAFDPLNETFVRIARDARHHRVRLLSYGVVEERLFAAWRMRGIGVFDMSSEVTRRLVEKYGEEDDDVRFPETGWRALALIEDIQGLRGLPEWKGEAGTSPPA